MACAQVRTRSPAAHGGVATQSLSRNSTCGQSMGGVSGCTSPSMETTNVRLQPFSQKSHTPTVPKAFQIGLYDPTEADLEHFWNCCSAGFLGERL